jgi:4-hydroxy-3-methylbut-2-en-1-yl diphosphate synthase IspG/GcpE
MNAPHRSRTRQLKLGDVRIGGGAPVVVQSMTNTDTRDAEATLEQIRRLHAAGCEVVRLAVPDEAAAAALKVIAPASPVPLIADIHFDWRLAIAALDAGLKGLRKTADLYGMAKLCEELAIGEPTVIDIITELEKPGRDIRDDLPMPELHSDILDISDLTVGMVLSGVVRNVIDFGAFIDIGVHQDGLVHVSEISKKFIKHPSEMLSVGDKVTVKIKSLDIAKKRIGLTMKNL